MTERTRRRSLVVIPGVPSPMAQAQAQAPRLRKKLQKSVTRQRNITGPKGRHSFDGSDQAASSDNKSDTANNKGTVAAHAQVQQQSCLLPALTPDLNDSKWSDYLLREAGCFCPKTNSTRESSLLLPAQPKESPEPLLQPPVQIIPELSHLAISNAKQQNPDSSSSVSPDPTSPMTVMDNQTQRRRRAKTPIFSIGQLENIPRPGNALASNEKRLSAEVMAEQYRALIASRNSILKETHSEPPQSRQGHRDDYDNPFDDEMPHHDMNHPSSANTDLLPPEVPLPNGSPTTSDDGTLVGFEEETVYFKPVSFSPEPETPDLEQQQRHFQSPLPGQIPGNLSLQICLDLLTRDLSSGLKGAGLSVNSGNNTSALQVWVMIEAYERLRDQLFAEASSGRLGNLGVGLDEVGGVGLMIDMWLRALYSIHDGLMGGRGHGKVVWDGENMMRDNELGMELGMEDLD